MNKRIFIVLIGLVAAALACTAPGAPVTPEVVTVVVTSNGAAPASTQGSAPTGTAQTGAPQGVSCTVKKDVKIHSCIGVTSASGVGGSPAGSTFTPTKWDGQNWFYGQIPSTSGPLWGWVSSLNSDGSTLVSCTGDTSALPKGYEPCPTAVPTSTPTPIPPTDTPVPTVTKVPTAVGLCGNGVADPGEQCGEPGLSCGGPIFRICQACKCVLPVIVIATP